MALLQGDHERGLELFVPHAENVSVMTMGTSSTELGLNPAAYRAGRDVRVYGGGMASAPRFVKPTLWSILAILVAAMLIGPYLLVNQLIVWDVEAPQCRTLCHRQGMTLVRYEGARKGAAAVCECRSGGKTVSQDVRFHLLEGSSGPVDFVLRLGVALVTLAVSCVVVFLLLGQLAGRLRRSREAAPADTRTPP